MRVSRGGKKGVVVAGIVGEGVSDGVNEGVRVKGKVGVGVNVGEKIGVGEAGMGKGVGVLPAGVGNGVKVGNPGVRVKKSVGESDACKSLVSTVAVSDKTIVHVAVGLANAVGVAGGG